MVIFHTDHWGALAHFIVLAVNRHRKEEKIFVFSEADKEKVIIAKALCENDIFQKVVFLKGSIFPEAKSEDKMQIKKAVLQTYNNLFKENHISIKADDTVYTTTDICGVFRYYLIENEIQFIHVMLDAADIYDRYKDIGAFKIGAVSRTYMDLLNENKVFNGKNPLCNKIIAFPNTEIRDDYLEYKNKFEKFDLQEQLKHLDRQVAFKIFSSFHLHMNELVKMKNVVLSNSEGFLWSTIDDEGYSGRNRMEHTLLYQILIDFYIDDPIESIVLKGHPNNFIDWKRYFNGISILDKNMPIELIQLCKEVKIEKALALQTTAISKIEDKIKEITLATVNFARYYHSFCRLFLACEIYKRLGCLTEIQEIGFRKDFFEGFLNYVIKVRDSKWCIPEKNDSMGSFYRLYYKLSISDMLNLTMVIKNMNQKSIIALLHIPNNMPIKNYIQVLQMYLVVFQIKKQPLKKEIVISLDTEYILLIVKSKEIREKLRTVKLDKILNVTGIHFCAEALSEFETQMLVENYKIQNEIAADRKLFEQAIFQMKQGNIGKSYALSLIGGFTEYMDVLSLTDHIIIFVAVKDNAGRYFGYGEMSSIERFELNVEWNKIGWRGYIAMIDEHKVIVDLLGGYDKALYYKNTYGLLDINMASKPYSQGNSAEIIINGIDYAVNGRGINIVVYDKTIKKVVDSVCFDTFVEACTCTRKNS